MDPPALPSTPDASRTPKKRKLDTTDTPASSPGPSDGTRTPTQNNDGFSLPNDKALVERPRLTISRHPTFIPIPNSGDPPLCNTDTLAMNRTVGQVGFRYYAAGLTEPGSVIAYRTIESRPPAFRISWEDRSPFIRVSEDGLTLGGKGGFRSARANTPVREGKWYFEVTIEKGGGDGHAQNGAAEGAHVRLGWGRREAPLNGPIGLDGYSYGYRDKTGEKVTLSRPKPYGKPFATGDVVGLYISLPPRRTAKSNDPNDPAHFRRERIAIEFKGQEYWESLEYSTCKEMKTLMDDQTKVPKPKRSNNDEDVPVNRSPSKRSATTKNAPPPARAQKPKEPTIQLRSLPTLGPQSAVAFFVNGECQGPAYTDLYDYLQLKQQPPKEKEKSKRKEHARQHVENPFDDGTLGYYPFFSLYNDARIRINPGPDFTYPPPADLDAVVFGTPNRPKADPDEATWRPICESYKEFMEEMWRLDVLDEERAKISQIETAAQEKEEEERQTKREQKRRLAAEKRKAKKTTGNTSASPEKKEAEDTTMLAPSDVVDFLAQAASSRSPSPTKISREPSEDLWPDSTSDTTSQGHLHGLMDQSSSPAPYDDEDVDSEFWADQGEPDQDGVQGDHSMQIYSDEEERGRSIARSDLQEGEKRIS